MESLEKHKGEKLAVALGYFDGVHKGHQKVLKSATEYAKINNCASGVFTFVFGKENTIKGKGVVSARERLVRISKTGIDYYLCPEYDDFKDLTPTEFVTEILIKKMNAVAVFTGDNFTFGRGGAGNVELLTKLCAEKNITHNIVDMQSEDGGLVSSTRIRELITSGEIEKANLLLGERYSVLLPVVKGQGIGEEKLGYPTINQLFEDGMTVPCSGVYISRVTINGAVYPAATGIGSRPTVDGTGVTCESFIIGFTGDLYGSIIKTELVKYLAPTKKFDNLEQLKACIQDAAKAAAEDFEKAGDF